MDMDWDISSYVMFSVRRPCCILSLGPDESLDVVDRYQNIRQRIEKYDPELAQKPEIIVLTKQDLVDEEELKS